MIRTIAATTIAVFMHVSIAQSDTLALDGVLVFPGGLSPYVFGNDVFCLAVTAPGGEPVTLATHATYQLSKGTSVKPGLSIFQSCVAEKVP